ncbi:MAG TPA: family 1 glycosylhydrolase [Tepidisphaeraceae bacterium]|jgi:beta-glucosidase/6-phospho-beta-glucosidase/beta-galactosidase/glycosyltransferase involved in cell wall biosynthesis
MLSTNEQLNRRIDPSVETRPRPVTADRLPFKQFVWGAGIECSFLPHLDVDQFKWTQHDRFWRDDFKRAKEELGINHLRYALPWHVLEAEPGKFQWGYADERIEELEKLGIEVMLDVMHFGTPRWLGQAVGDPEFPESLERFTHEIVSRYRGSIKTWCPCNEPLVCALFSGDFGFWPPHARKWHGYMPVLSRVVQGVSRGIRAIRSAMPEATVLLCDAAENFKTRDESLQIEVNRRNLRRYVVMDLLTGQVDQEHPLYAWLKGYGISDLDLEWFRTHRQSPDVLGLDYYPHSDWQIEKTPGGGVRQRRADTPVGLYGLGLQYYQRYGLPLMLTETSIEGAVMNREMWFEITVEHCQRLRNEGIPMLGYIWWPLLDQVDWDGALTHRIGKIHEVGLYKLARQTDGTLNRVATEMVKVMRDAAASGEELVGKLQDIVSPTEIEAEQYQGPPIGEAYAESLGDTTASPAPSARRGNGDGNGHGKYVTKGRLAESAAGASAEPLVAERILQIEQNPATVESKLTDRYGLVVFSHLRWGFVWQRPQQFLSRFARKHQVLFVEEPFFDQAEGDEPRLAFHRVMPNVIVASPHLAPSWNRNPKLPEQLREFTRQAIAEVNDEGLFDKPLLWYYSPMDSSWSLGHFENRGIVYDSMDELSQFTGAPRSLIANEKRLMEYADIVFTGGYELWLKKKQQHDNVHFFGCGVEFSHFAKAQDPATTVPPDIDFMARPILGWFGVVDERVDYGMVGEMARQRPDWSFAMVGPVVKVDPNLLPHSPNLFWMGQRDYQVLPNYCAAFDVCMMPFAINAATQYINPTKALEYFATGRPVISTPVADVVRQYSDLVAIVKSADEFIVATEQALNHPDQDRIRRGTEKARASSWENTVATMQRLIKVAISKDQRQSKRTIEPLAEMELAYQYQATQGS